MTKQSFLKKNLLMVSLLGAIAPQIQANELCQQFQKEHHLNRSLLKTDLDCTVEKIQDHPYQTTVKYISDYVFKSGKPYYPKGYGGSIADISVLPITQDELLQRFFPNGDNLVQFIRKMKKDASETDISRFIASAFPRLPGLSFSQMMDLIDTQKNQCGYSENHNPHLFW